MGRGHEPFPRPSKSTSQSHGERDRDEHNEPAEARHLVNAFTISTMALVGVCEVCSTVFSLCNFSSLQSQLNSAPRFPASSVLFAVWLRDHGHGDAVSEGGAAPNETRYRQICRSLLEQVAQPFCMQWL